MSIKRIYIEITNNCNLNCSFCLKNTRKPRFMHKAEFQRIIKQIKPLTSYIYLHVQGEPLMHPMIDTFLTLCDQENLHVQLVTNGTLIKNHMHIDQHPSLRKISFSLHSIDQQTQDIQTYYQPIENFINKAKNTYIELRFWNRNHMGKRSQAIYEIIKQKYTLQPTKKADSYQLTKNIFLYFQDEFEWPSSAANADHDGYCYAADNMLAILADGQVSLCCLDAQGEINLGNIFKQDMSEIINGPKYQKIIKDFHDNHCHESLCQRCTYRQRFKN